jgi:hypothetical protein
VTRCDVLCDERKATKEKHCFDGRIDPDDEQVVTATRILIAARSTRTEIDICPIPASRPAVPMFPLWTRPRHHRQLQQSFSQSTLGYNSHIIRRNDHTPALAKQLEKHNELRHHQIAHSQARFDIFFDTLSRTSCGIVPVMEVAHIHREVKELICNLCPKTSMIKCQ